MGLFDFRDESRSTLAPDKRAWQVPSIIVRSGPQRPGPLLSGCEKPMDHGSMGGNVLAEMAAPRVTASEIGALASGSSELLLAYCYYPVTP